MNNNFQHPLEIFEKQLADCSQLYSFNEKIAEWTGGLFNGVAQAAENYGSPLTAKTARNLIPVVHSLHKVPDLQIPFGLLYDQGLVLAVSALETYLKSCFLVLCRLHPLKVLDQNSEFKITSDQFKQSGFRVDEYLGDIVLARAGGDINFQDLGSTVKTFKDYFGIEVSNIIDSQRKGRLIFSQALRHIIVHRAKIADEKFIKQIKNTEKEDRYLVGDEVILDLTEARRLTEEIRQFGKELSNLLP